MKETQSLAMGLLGSRMETSERRPAHNQAMGLNGVRPMSDSGSPWLEIQCQQEHDHHV